VNVSLRSTFGVVCAGHVRPASTLAALVFGCRNFHDTQRVRR
jgi:hypothetical protein